MTKSVSLLRGLLAVAALVSGSVSAAGGSVEMESAQVDLGNKGSLQRGAALYMNYCASCHSLGYQRYSRMAEDLGLSPVLHPWADDQRQAGVRPLETVRRWQGDP